VKTKAPARRSNEVGARASRFPGAGRWRRRVWRRSGWPVRDALQGLGSLLILYGLSRVLRARRHVAPKAGRAWREAAGWATLLGGWALAAAFTAGPLGDDVDRVKTRGRASEMKA
jgi:hypothetical protein